MSQRGSSVPSPWWWLRKVEDKGSTRKSPLRKSETNVRADVQASADLKRSAEADLRHETQDEGATQSNVQITATRRSYVDPTVTRIKQSGGPREARSNGRDSAEGIVDGMST